MLRPFFCYYGGKYRAAAHYPSPQRSKIIEPFAGAAGYSTRHHTADVLLLDADPVIVGVWSYLIRTPASEIRRLPLLTAEQTVDAMRGVPEEAKWLVGFWLNKGTAAPCKRPSAWMRKGTHVNSFWGETIRDRIASQVASIRHWRVRLDGYAAAPDVDATWYVDPPYQMAGKHYRYGSALLDYSALGEWCRSRRGQVIVCENEGAEWLPFVSFRTIKGTAGRSRSGKSDEVVWLNVA